MVERTEISIIPLLQKKARLAKSGIIIDRSSDPNILSAIPEIFQETLANGGSIIIDYTGELTITNLNGISGEKK